MNAKKTKHFVEKEERVEMKTERTDVNVSLMSVAIIAIFTILVG